VRIVTFAASGRIDSIYRTAIFGEGRLPEPLLLVCLVYLRASLLWRPRDEIILWCNLGIIPQRDVGDRMRLFGDTKQVVLQNPIAAGFECKCFSSVAAPNPALICVAPCGGPQAHTDARKLAHNLSRTLATLSTDPSAIPAPCGSSSAGPRACRAHREPTCRRVLKLVGDGTVELDDHATGHRDAIDYWVQEMSAGNTNFAVVPALAESLLPRSFSLLGSLLRPYNGCFWRSDPGTRTHGPAPRASRRNQGAGTALSIGARKRSTPGVPERRPPAVRVFTLPFDDEALSRRNRVLVERKCQT
jgi:hypothetical protein